MSHKLVYDASFHQALLAFDQILASKVQRANCSFCGGCLEIANFPRSPMGVAPAYRHYYEVRLSYCCANCRRRHTPASVRFFGRRWFPAPLMVLSCLLTLGINERRLKQVQRHFGITLSGSTWKRWRRWWREQFISTQFWQYTKGLCVPTLDEHTLLPRALWRCFHGSLPPRLRSLLEFLSPLTGGNLRAV